jgi:hypothetical protein
MRACLAALGDGGHGEGAGAVEPERVLQPAMELEERMAVAAGAVA